MQATLRPSLWISVCEGMRFCRRRHQSLWPEVSSRSCQVFGRLCAMVGELVVTLTGAAPTA